MTEHVLVERRGPHLRLVLNRPERRNAITVAMYAALADAITAAQDDPAFRVIVSDQSTDEADFQHPAARAMTRVLEAQGRSVELLRHLPRRGLAEHRQFLLDQATAPAVLFLKGRGGRGPSDGNATATTPGADR